MMPHLCTLLLYFISLPFLLLAQPDHNIFYASTSRSRPILNVFGEDDHLREECPEIFAVSDPSDCRTAISAIPQGLLGLDPSSPCNLAVNPPDPSRRGNHRKPKKTNTSSQEEMKWKLNLIGNRTFTIPAIFRYRSCMVLIAPDGEPYSLPSTHPHLDNSKAASSMYFEVFPNAHRMAEKLLSHYPDFDPFSDDPSTYLQGKIKSRLGNGRIVKHVVMITGVPDIRYFTECNYRAEHRIEHENQQNWLGFARKSGENHYVRTKQFPEEGWQVSLWPREHGYQRGWKYNVYEALGSWSGPGTKGFWEIYSHHVAAPVFDPRDSMFPEASWALD